MKCKVYWPEEDAWFHGMIKDVRRNLKAKYNVGTAENEKFEERVIKKAFFVRYDDGDRDWLQIFKFSQGEGEEKQVVCINKSQQLDYYWDDDLKEYRESARDYEPKPIQERRDEIVREEEEREEKRKRKDKEEEERERKRKEIVREEEERKRKQKKQKDHLLVQNCGSMRNEGEPKVWFQKTGGRWPAV